MIQISAFFFIDTDILILKEKKKKTTCAKEFQITKRGASEALSQKNMRGISFLFFFKLRPFMKDGRNISICFFLFFFS